MKKLKIIEENSIIEDDKGKKTYFHVHKTVSMTAIADSWYLEGKESTFQ